MTKRFPEDYCENCFRVPAQCRCVTSLEPLECECCGATEGQGHTDGCELDVYPIDSVALRISEVKAQ